MSERSGEPHDRVLCLYDRHGASLYRYALMLVADPAAAEDAVQQVFTSVLRSGASQRLEAEESYLRRAIRNECYSMLRRKTMRDPIQMESDALLEQIASIDSNPDERLALDRGLRSLTPQQREVVHLHVFEGLTFREIAESSGTSINTVAARYRYALGKLRALLDGVRLNAVIQALKLDRPVLCGWSYGTLVILDYVRHYGEEAVRGMSFVGGITKLGSDEAISVLTPEFLSQVPGFFATDVEDSARSLESLLRMCLAEEPSAEELYLMLGYNLSVPPHVRQALFSRSFSNDDLLPKLRKPVLIVHGAEDAIVKPAVVDQHRAGIAHARVEMMPKTGHAPFWEDAATFNGHLQSFCERLEVQAVS